MRVARALTRLCASVQSRLSLGFRPMQNVPKSHELAGIELFFMLNPTEHGIYPAHIVKIQTIVGISTSFSNINTKF